MHRIAAVIPSAGHDESLHRAVASVVRAAAAADVSEVPIVVVDDALSPRADLVASLGHTSLTVFRGGRVGAGPARNLGAATVDADWLLFVDDDVEVDEAAIVALDREVIGPGRSEVVLGTTRPPRHAPDWLVDAYTHGVLGTTLTPPGGLTGGATTGLVSTLFAIEREVFHAVGGYPECAEWGVTDVLLAERLARLGVGQRQVPGFSGVHNYVPTWQEWLERRQLAGERFAVLARELESDAATRLLAATRLDGSLRSLPKRLASYLPGEVLRQARGRFLRRLAAAGVEAKSFRRGR